MPRGVKVNKSASRKPRYKDHPFWEEADLIDDLLRTQRFHDKRNDGVSVIPVDSEPKLREERDRLRHLARLDIDEGTYPV
jgi:hypothetical protein